MNVTQKLPLLADLSPQAFMQTYWQKKPLLVRAAVSEKQLAQLPKAQALRDWGTTTGVTSRFIRQTKGAWTLRHGPFKPRAMANASQQNWTLLIQSVDLLAPAVYALLQKFRFCSDARLDDAMFSLAGVGGGVGPHTDSYDVFLLQTSGRRRWRIGAQKEVRLVPDLPLKILQHFEPTQTYVLEAGDMLYLPPNYAHEGVALDDPSPCITCSIGFKAPHAGVLAQEMMDRLGEDLDEQFSASDIYTDEQQAASSQPARVPKGLHDFATQALQRVLSDQTSLAIHLGEYLTEPKPEVWFDAPVKKISAAQLLKQAINLHPATRMLYDDQHVFINGESYIASGLDARLLHALADDRQLSAPQLAKGSFAAQELIRSWVNCGWLNCGCAMQGKP